MTTSFRLLVCGGRDYADRTTVYEVLDRVHRWAQDMGYQLEVVHGDARGADRLARDWARARGVTDHPEPARWATEGYYAAGPKRNQRMVDKYHPAKCIAFPGGTGTADMIRRCVAHSIPVVKVP